MTITHAMEATRAQRKVRVLRHDDDTYTVEMDADTAMPGESPIIGSCKLNREELVLLTASLTEFIKNIDQFEIDLKGGE